MNKQRRKELDEIIDRLSEITLDLDHIMNREQDALDSLPENLWQSERAEKMQNAIYEIASAIEYIDSSIETIKTAQE